MTFFSILAGAEIIFCFSTKSNMIFAAKRNIFFTDTADNVKFQLAFLGRLPFIFHQKEKPNFRKKGIL